MRHFSFPCALLAFSAALVSLSACGGGGGGESDADAAVPPTAAQVTTLTTAVSVIVLDNLFNPGQRSIKIGEEVNWDWDGKNPHSVVGTFEGTAIDSGQKSGKGRFTFKFETAGTFEYQCGVHGAGMSGKITVR